MFAMLLLKNILYSGRIGCAHRLIHTSQASFQQSREDKTSEWMEKYMESVQNNPEGNEEELYPEPKGDYLEKSYENYETETKKRRKMAKHGMIQRKFFKEPKQPNMLTSNEKYHIKYLHQQNPHEWTVEKLSESFPALPHVIKRILKNDYRPTNMEKVKKRDEMVLKNWEKLKKNELEATPENIEHLKKFIDRRDNLSAQLQSNPNFFYFPEQKKPLSWHNGEMNSLLEHYERKIVHLQKLKSLQSNFQSLPGAADEESKVTATTDDPRNANEVDIEKEIEMEKKIQNVRNRDNFLIGRTLSDEKHVTLEEMKKEMLQKSESGSLPAYEKSILTRSLDRRTDRKSFDANEKENESEHHEKPSDDEEEIRKKVESIVWGSDSKREDRQPRVEPDQRQLSKSEEIPRRTGGRRIRKTSSAMEEKPFSVVRSCGNTKVLKENELFMISQCKSEKNPEPEETKRIEKKPVNFWGTEKDESHCKEEVELLSATVFWNDEEARKKSQCEPLKDKNVSPHVAQQLGTFFSSDYPTKITIPKEKWKKGMTFKVEDCFYDDRGVFMYRVPGLVE